MHIIVEAHLRCVSCSSNEPKWLQSKGVQESKNYVNQMSVKETSPILLCYSWCGKSVCRLRFYMNCSQKKIRDGKPHKHEKIRFLTVIPNHIIALIFRGGLRI